MRNIVTTRLGLHLRNVGTNITIIWILAILGFSATILFLLFSGLDVGDEWTNRAQVGAAISSAFALILSILAVVVTVRISSSDYKAEQEVRVHTVELLAANRSIILKAAQLTQTQHPLNSILDFKKEHEVINNFLSSTTAFAFWSWIGLKKSPQSGSDPDEWRVFFLYLTQLLETEKAHFRTMGMHSVKIEKLLTQLTETDIRDISNHVLNLSSAIAEFQKTQKGDPLIAGVWAAWGKPNRRDPKLRQQLFLEILKTLRNSGIQDPDLDMWYAVITGDAALLKSITNYDPSLTDEALLSRYRNLLETQHSDLLKKFEEA